MKDTHRSKRVLALKRLPKTYRPRCSGYRVFPDGKRCKGCQDCGSINNKNPRKAH